MRKTVALAIALLLTLGVGQAAALPFTLSFTAVVPGFPAGPNISGSFQYEAPSAIDPISALTGVDLTLSGHVFTLAETGVGNFGASFSQFGGLTGGGIGSLDVGANDFILAFNRATGTPISLFVSSPVQASTFPGTFTAFSVAPTPTAVPEPVSVVLVALGLAELGLRRFRKRT